MARASCLNFCSIEWAPLYFFRYEHNKEVVLLLTLLRQNSFFFFFFLRKNIFFSPSWTNGRRNFSCWSSLSHFEQITKWNRKKKKKKRERMWNGQTIRKMLTTASHFLIEGWIGSCKLKNFLPVFFQTGRLQTIFSKIYWFEWN